MNKEKWSCPQDHNEAGNQTRKPIIAIQHETQHITGKGLHEPVETAKVCQCDGTAALTAVCD